MSTWVCIDLRSEAHVNAEVRYGERSGKNANEVGNTPKEEVRQAV
jgi:hypothetical protein